MTRVHGHVAAALLAEMQDVQGSAPFEKCETRFGGGPGVTEARGQIRVVES